MGEEKTKLSMPHSLILDNRKSLSISGVSDVDSFDEQSITVYTAIGDLTIKGKDLHINTLNIETGDLQVNGKIDSLIYSESNQPLNKGLFSRLFR